VLEEGGAFLLVERLVVGAGQAGVEGVFDFEFERRTRTGLLSPVEDECLSLAPVKMFV